MTERVARNTFYLTAASVGQKIIAFVYFLFLARIMMPDATGQYFLALSITVIFSVIADLGITVTVIREIAKRPEQAYSLVGHALGLKIPLTILAVIGAVVTGWLLGYDAQVQLLILLATVVLVLDSLQVFFYGVLRGYQKLEYESIGIFAGMLTTALFGGLVLWLYPSLPLLVVALMLGSLVNLLVSGSYVVTKLSWANMRPRWSKAVSGWLFKTAFPFALAAIFVKVYSYIDSIFISKFLDIASVGLYAIAYKFTYAFQFFPLAFNAALYPALSAVVGKDVQALERTFLRGMWYMAVLSAPIVFGLYAIAPEAILLAGEEYAMAYRVLQLLIFVLIPIFLDFPIGALLNASGKQVVKTTIMGITMVINIILNAWLIPKLGIIGAGYAAIFSFVFMMLAGLVYIPQMIPGFSFARLARATLPAYVAGGAMLVSVLVLKPVLGWLFVIPVGGLIYVLALWLLGAVKRSDLTLLTRYAR